MANLKSAIKRIRQNRKRNAQNRQSYSKVNTAVKSVRGALGEKDVKAAELALTKAIPLLHKAAQKKLIHLNQASRKISRLTLQVNSLRQPQTS